MNNRICPACGTGECKFRDGIMCRSWVCASGVYKGTSGNKGVDKLNTAYHQSNSAAAFKAGMDGFQNIMDMFSKYQRGERQ